MWGANYVVLSSTLMQTFQSTHPCGVRSNLWVFEQVQDMFQSTHPCGVRISDFVSVVVVGGFNPRTRVGCECKMNSGENIIISFNPRTRVGCEDNYLINGEFVSKVSIHAPVWGAKKRVVLQSYHNKFQSTHPCGVRNALLLVD